MDIDPLLVLAGLGVGLLVGLTGMGGGALLTPLLVLGFGIPPLVAVGSDLVASLTMKPVGGAVHLRRGTVDLRLVWWLAAGSVPSAFLGAALLGSISDADGVQEFLRQALGLALILSALSMLVKSVLIARAGSRGRFEQARSSPPAVRPLPTLTVGIFGGCFVGMTSVGSGSLIIVLLMLVYPGMTARALVGTDLVQAVPLVGAAALGHLLFGEVEFALTASLVIGSLPGVYVGARLSSSISTTLIRRVLVFVLFGTGLKLLGAPAAVMATLLMLLALLALPTWARMRAVVAGWRAPSSPPDGRR